MNKQEFDKKYRAIMENIDFWMFQRFLALENGDSVLYNYSVLNIYYWQQKEILLDNEFMESIK